MTQETLDKKAERLARLGMVTRIGSRFRVTNPSGRSGQPLYSMVWRDSSGSVRCDCVGFTKISTSEADYRCVHVRAVKFAIAAKVCEPASQKKAEVPVKTSKPESLTKTESRQSGCGEQKPAERSIELPGNRRSGNLRIAARRLGLTKGNKTMKQNKNPETELEFVPEVEQGTDIESPDNVLNFTSTLRELRRHLDPHLVKQREGWRGRDGKIKMVDYIEWHTVADILDETAPNWEHRIKEIRPIGDVMTVTVAITIDGVTREGIGTGMGATELGIKKAEHDALKRAAVKFGIARDLYKKEFEAADKESDTGSEPQPPEFPADPVAMNVADMVTTKQLGLIRSLAREKGVDHDQTCLELMKCRTAELSKRAASSFIDHLQSLDSIEPANIPFRRAG